ncbi:Conserved oligomeric Golgi complex subunit 8 [Trichinella papuae]|uniref:Conserved oligomeric Golgi complex subunit 8 n=1 Tax=Trichinella papuae TaxID=268474 RepID=A0A0V1MZY2_9BILA|nr:Conserved oligomeric Golgi complex subunit 8 [Trichinella papuae]
MDDHRKSSLENVDQLEANTCGDYLEKIYKLEPNALPAESRRLEKEKADLLKEIENLAFSHYDTFIQTTCCSEKISNHLKDISAKLEKFRTDIGSLKSDCIQYVQSSQKLCNEKEILADAKTACPDVVAILHVPELIESSVRRGRYEKAFELIQFITRLDSRLQDVPLVQDVARQVKNQRNYLLECCLEQLRSDLNLTQCLKIISFLRRMAIYTESELRMQFLFARDEWIQRCLDAEKFNDSYQMLIRTVDVYRSCLFDVMIQYRAAFSEENSSISKLWPKEEIEVDCSSIVSSWIYYRVEQFLEIIVETLPKCPTDRLDSVMTQCMHFGSSMGRVGADVRMLFVSIFENFFKSTTKNSLQKATANAVERLQMRKNLSDCRVSCEMKISSEVESLKPPVSLLAYPSLAIYCNEIIEIFNFTRNLPAVNFACFLLENLENSLRSVAATLSQLSNTDDLTDEEKKIVSNMMIIFSNDFLIYLNSCLKVLFPTKLITQALCLTSFGLYQDRIKLQLNAEDLCPWERGKDAVAFKNVDIKNLFHDIQHDINADQKESLEDWQIKGQNS